MSELIVNTIKTGDLETDIYIDRSLKVSGKLIIEDVEESEIINNDNNKILIINTESNTVNSVSFTKLMPPGTIMPYGGDSIPEGWLLCNGNLVNRNDFSDLFSSIGTKWGAGDSVTTFSVPDLRGQFLRGVDLDGEIDPGCIDEPKDDDVRKNKEGTIVGGVVGSFQDDAFQGHWHNIEGTYSVDGTVNNGFSEFTRDTEGIGTYSDDDEVHNPIEGSHGQVHLSTETRPKNAAVHYIIKY